MELTLFRQTLTSPVTRHSTGWFELSCRWVDKWKMPDRTAATISFAASTTRRVA